MNSEQFHMLLQVLAEHNDAICTKPIWVCARSSYFGIRPSQVLSGGLSYIIRVALYNAITKLKHVIVPIIFYPCGVHDKEVDDSKEDDDFLIYNHVNVFLCHYDTGRDKLVVERYEPSDCLSHKQIQAHKRMLEMFTYYFHKESKGRVQIEFFSVVEKGGQSRYGDKHLCTFHSIYWLLMRLQLGLEKSRKAVFEDFDEHHFESFERCIKRILFQGK